MERGKNWQKSAELNLKNAEENLDRILKSKDNLNKNWGKRKMVDDQEGLKKCQTTKRPTKRPKTQESDDDEDDEEEEETSSKKSKTTKEESDSEEEEESESASSDND